MGRAVPLLIHLVEMGKEEGPDSPGAGMEAGVVKATEEALVVGAGMEVPGLRREARGATGVEAVNAGARAVMGAMEDSVASAGVGAVTGDKAARVHPGRCHMGSREPAIARPGSSPFEDHRINLWSIGVCYERLTNTDGKIQLPCPTNNCFQ